MKLVKEHIDEAIKHLEPRSDEEIEKSINSIMSPEDIEFKSELTDSGSRKISFRIKGHQPRWKALYRSDDDHFVSGDLNQLITDFLNSPDTKKQIAKLFSLKLQYLIR